MKYFDFLITGSIAGVLVTSAVVVAQAPKVDPVPATKRARQDDPAQKEFDARVRAQKQLVAQQEKARAAGAQAEAVLFQKAAAPNARIARQPNLENVVTQYMRQARPLVRAELIFVRKVCSLDLEQFRRIHQDTEVAFKKAITQLVESQQQVRVRVAGGVQQRAEAPDAISLVRGGIAAVLKSDLTPEHFARYESEVAKRDAFQKQSAVAYLVETIDRDLYLSDDQRQKLTESLSSHWDPSWQSSLEYCLYGNRFFPAGVEPYVMPYLDPTQRKIWAGVQKVAPLGGAFGMLGSFLNDPDTLQPELGEDQKPGPRQVVPNRQRDMQKIEIRKGN